MGQKDPVPTRISKRVNNRSNKLKRTFRIILAVPLIGLAVLLTAASFILGATISTWKELDLKSWRTSNNRLLSTIIKMRKLPTFMAVKIVLKYPFRIYPSMFRMLLSLRKIYVSISIRVST